MLLASNAIAAAYALYEGWSLYPLLWIYWGQSVCIGIFHFITILRLKEFNTRNVMINNRSVSPTDEVKRKTAWFFLFHYGFFHLFYFGALIVLPAFMGTARNGAPIDFGSVRSIARSVILLIVLFFIQQLMTFIQRTRMKLDNPNIGTLMFFPYVRILPMHLVVFTSFYFQRTEYILAFLAVKTVADIVMYAVETIHLKYVPIH
jgi:hypothetical protein